MTTQFTQLLGNCSPVSTSSASVITASYSKWTKCHSSGYINSTALGQKIIKILFLNKSRAEEVSGIGTKKVGSIKSLPDAEELYISYFNIPFQLKEPR